MERSEILTAMAELKLYGMKAAFDEIISTAVKRQHEPQRIVGDLLAAEITEKQARSIRYQITIAKLPLAKDIDDFSFDGTPINETLVRDLLGGNFLAHQMWFWWVEPVPARRTLPLPLLSPAPAFVMVPEASSMLSIWSTNLRLRPEPDGRGAWPTICAEWTS